VSGAVWEILLSCSVGSEPNRGIDSRATGLCQKADAIPQKGWVPQLDDFAAFNFGGLGI
jgi:hypothetical protein